MWEYLQLKFPEWSTT